MDEIILYDDEYKSWIKDISKRYKACQIKAAVSVNSEVIAFYWSLGRDIVQREAEKKYGSKFYATLSNDLKSLNPGVQGFASTNLRYMVKFYTLYSDVNLPQAVGKSDYPNLPQLVGDLDESELFAVPWGHHRTIIDKCKTDRNKAIFFVRKIIQNNWSGRFWKTF